MLLKSIDFNTAKNRTTSAWSLGLIAANFLEPFLFAHLRLIGEFAFSETPLFNVFEICNVFLFFGIRHVISPYENRKPAQRRVLSVE